MLQKLLLVLLPLFTAIPLEDNLIDWNAARRLTWEDFKGKPDPASGNAALTNSGINVEFGISDKKLTHTIKCRFNKEKSWGRIKTAYILNHEQGHFDITEIHARLLHKELSGYQFNAKTVNQDINNIYNGVMKLHVTAQRNYDLETNHSLDSTQQSLWDNKITSMLKKYEKYQDYN
jgi:predicted secreted Zn-dependent protease